MESIRQLADSLKRTYGTSDPVLICHLMGYYVLPSELPEYIDGFYLKAKDRDWIFLNQELSPLARRQTCAHELGHALLHPGVNACQISYYTNLLCSGYEKEADYFCACLLIDEELLDGDLQTVQQLAAVCGVSEELALLRLKQHRRKTRRPFAHIPGAVTL